MRKTLLMITATLFLSTALFAQDDSKKEEKKVETKKVETTKSEDKSIGLSFGVDYWSLYIWRGQDFYSGDGAFFPWISFAVGDTGLSLGYAGEYSAETLGDDATTARGLNAADFGADYSYTVKSGKKSLVTVGVGVWYYWFYQSKTESGKEENGGEEIDASFGSATLSLAIDALPLTPTISYTHDYYVDKDFCTDKKNDQDYYINFSIGHDFEMVKGSTLSLGANVGYYNARSVSKSGAEQRGVSDIGASMKIETTKSTSHGDVTIYGQMNFTYVPYYRHYRPKVDGEYASTDELDNKYKWWAAFGASYAL